MHCSLLKIVESSKHITHVNIASLWCQCYVEFTGFDKKIVSCNVLMYSLEIIFHFKISALVSLLKSQSGTYFFSGEAGKFARIKNTPEEFKAKIDLGFFSEYKPEDIDVSLFTELFLHKPLIPTLFRDQKSYKRRNSCSRLEFRFPYRIQIVETLLSEALARYFQIVPEILSAL